MKHVYKIASIALVAWAVFTVLVWTERMASFWYSGWAIPVWLGMLLGVLKYILWPWGTALVTLAVAAVIGDYLSDLDSKGTRDSLLQTAIGLGVISVATLLLGLAHALYAPVMFVIALVVLARGYRRLWRVWGLHWYAVRTIRGWHWMEWLLLVPIAWYVWRTIALTGCPPTGWDELNSHLHCAKWYVLQHRIWFMPESNFNNFPLGLEMLIVQQRLWTQYPGAVWPYLFHLGTLVLIWKFVHDRLEPRDRSFWTKALRRAGKTNMTVAVFVAMMRNSRLTATIAVLIYLSIPLVTRHSQAVLTDPVVTFYCLAMLYAMTSSRTSSMCVGLLAGCALGIKYVAMPWVLIAVLVSLAYRPDRHTLKLMGRMLMWAGVMCGAWYIRNLILFGNPVFPFFNEHIPLEWGTVAAQTQYDLMTNHHAMLANFRCSWWAWPWELSMTDSSPWVTGSLRPGDIGPWLLALVPLALLGWRRIGVVGRYSLLVALLYVMYWTVWQGLGELRYMMPAMPVLAALSAVAVGHVLRSDSHA